MESFSNNNDNVAQPQQLSAALLLPQSLVSSPSRSTSCSPSRSRSSTPAVSTPAVRSPSTTTTTTSAAAQTSLPQPSQPLESSQPSQTSASASKKNFTWRSEDIERLVAIIYDNETFQQVLLPSRESSSSGSLPKLSKQMVYSEIFRQIFPGVRVDNERIKSKIRWVLKNYVKEKKKLSRTGAGTLLHNMNTNNPAYVSRAGLAQRFGWFEQMDEMMQDRYTADTAALITTPSLDQVDDDVVDMDMSSDAGVDHAGHGHGVPPLLDIVDQDQSGATAATFNNNTNPIRASQLTPGPTSGPSMPFSPEASISPSSTQASPATKRKRGVSEKRDALAEAYYNLSVEKSRIKLQLEQERRRWVEVAEQQRTKRMEMRMKDQEDKCKQEERLKAQDKETILAMARMLAGKGEGSSNASGRSNAGVSN